MTICPRRGWTAAALLAAFLLGGCNSAELKRLREENDRLRRDLAAKPSAPEVKLQPLDEFTVGLAAAEKSFDENAFLTHLRTSLQDSVRGDGKFAISAEDEEQEVAKVRGMLIQQYLAEKKVPIRISSLGFKLRDPRADFKIGGAMVPREGLEVEKGPDGTSRFTYKGSLLAQMDRESPEKFSLPFESSEGSRGAIALDLGEAEVMNPSGEARTARQGDVSLAWQLSLEKIRVYRIAGYQGDVGSFVNLMRYPTAGLNQYQTIRDTVFLFGYGPYFTGLVNRLETPRFIDQVDVLPLQPEVYEQIKVGMSEDQLTEILRAQPERGVTCNFVEFAEDKKIWERPIAVQFPFLSRQISQQKDKVFYTKYDAKGPVLIGDYRIKSR